jgi:hypothetical protein
MTTKTVTGYKFQVEAAAANAQNSLRVHYLGNRPAPPQGETWTTTEWVSVETGTFEGNTFYYFLGDYAPVLGNPTEFDIDYDDTI